MNVDVLSCNVLQRNAMRESALDHLPSAGAGDPLHAVARAHVCRMVRFWTRAWVNVWVSCSVSGLAMHID